MSEATQTPGTNVAPMPSRFSEVRTIGEALRHPDVVDRFRQAVPRHLSPERMLRVCALAVHKTPKLAECDMMSLLGAMLALGSLGLEPNTPLGLAYLIPFEKRGKVNGVWQTVGVEVQVIIGYRGYIDLARRAGTLVSLHADVMYHGDEFSFEYGSKAHLRHVPMGVRDGRPPVWAYAHARLTDGEAFEVLPYGQVLRIRDGSQGYISAVRGKEKNARAFEANPWVAYEHEMAAKTMIRRIAKMLPMSIEMMNAATLDGLSETGKVNLRELATSPTSELMDIALLAHEEHIPVMDLGAGAGDDREKEPAPVHREQPTQTGRSMQREPPQQQQAAAAPAWEAWASDEIGEPVELHGAPLVFRDPAVFASWYTNRWLTSDNREALRDNNADALADAMRHPEAAEILANAEARPGPKADQAKVNPMLVGIPVNAKGHPFLAGYIAAVKTALASFTRPEGISEWIAVNSPTYTPLPRATKTAVETAISDRRAQLGLSSETGQPVTAEAAQPGLGIVEKDWTIPDEAWTDELIARIEAAGTLADLRALGADQAINARLKDVAQNRPDLVARIRDADKARGAALGGPTA